MMDNSKEQAIVRTHAIYNKVALWLLCALSLASFLLMNVLFHTEWLSAVVVSFLFNYVCCLAYGIVWKSTARRSPDLLPKLYLAASVLRILLAAVVLLIYCVIMRGQSEQIRTFAIVFVIYYLVVLVFDAIFFAKISKQNIL